MAIGDSMVLFGVLFLVGLLVVGFLILGAALAARPETRTAGLWIMGVIFAMAVAIPLAWFFASSASSPQTTWIQDGSGRMVPVVTETARISPIVSMLGILVVLAAVAGLIALIVNQRTRRVGVMILSCGFIFLVGYIMIGSASLHVQAPAQPTPITSGKAVSQDWSESVTIAEETHQIPVESAIKAPMHENVTTPAASDAVASAPTASEPPAPSVSKTTEAIPQSAPPIQSPSTQPPAATPPAATPPTPGAAAPAPTPGNTLPANLRYLPPEITTSQYPLQSGDRESLPEWAKQGGGLSPDGTYYTIVKCGPHLNFDSCWQDLRLKVDDAVRTYRSRSWQEGFRVPNRSLPDHVRNQLMTDKYLELGDSSVGNTMTLYTKVAFTKDVMASLQSWQTDLLAQNRTFFTTIIGALVVGLIAVAYGYFRIDTATLGYYTWRLRFVALFIFIGIAISGIAAGAVFFEEENRLGGIDLF